MPSISVVLPSVHMAGSDAHYDAHFEVSRHGLALFLTPDAEYPVLDINGTPSQLDDVLRELQGGIEANRAQPDAEQLDLPR